MAEVFNFPVQASPSGQVAFRTLNASFGDGYEQSAADGINNRVHSWNIRVRGLLNNFCIPVANIADVIAFLDARAGWQSFLWTPPLGSQGLYKARNYSLEKSGGVVTLTATFVEAFLP